MEQYEKTIGKLNRTLTLHDFKYGIFAVVEDRTVGNELSQFTTRRFNISKTSPTIEDCKERAKRYFKIK